MWKEAIDFVGLGASVASGGLFGLLGSVIGVGAKWLQRREARIQAREEHQMRIETMKVQMEITAQQGSWNGLTASQQAETAINSQPTYKWVVAAKSLFRPVLTLTLWAIAAYLFIRIVDGSLKEWFDAKEVQDLVRYMIYTTFFAASTATVWWFGDRALNPPELKNR